MSEQAPRREPMTNGEREILFQMQQLQARWVDLVHICINHMGTQRFRIDELCQNVQDLTKEVQELKQRSQKTGCFNEVGAGYPSVNTQYWTAETEAAITTQEILMNNILQLRPVDRKRLDRLQERAENPLTHDSIGYVHTILTQCFLPYKDPKATHWKRKNGKYSIILTAGFLDDPAEDGDIIPLGLPFGAKPRLFQSYVCTKAIKHQSRVIPVERSMTAMIHELGFDARGGKRGSINSFKEQINRFARCRFDIVILDAEASTQTYIKAEPIESFKVWFAQNPDHHSFWPSEIVLTDQFYQSLKEHAVPHDFRALAAIQNKPRAIDIYLWMTQRQCRIPHHKPLLMRWKDLHEMFGGQSPRKAFKRDFPADLMAARTCYSDAKIEEHPEGYLFKRSLPPIPKTQILIPR